LAEFVSLSETKGLSENSWTVDIKDIDQSTFDLSVKNPNKKEETALRQPQAILAEMQELDNEAQEVRTLIERIIGLPD
jgi:type I restriction enzyme M protein